MAGLSEEIPFVGLKELGEKMDNLPYKRQIQNNLIMT